MPVLGPARVNGALYAFSGECEAKKGVWPHFLPVSQVFDV